MTSLHKKFSLAASSFMVKLTIIVIAAVGGGALVSSAVVAALTATANNATPHSITTGTLKLTLAPSAATGITGGFSTAITAMAPGDTINRYVNLTNAGTLDGATPVLSVAAPTSTKLDTDATNGLSVTIQNCTNDWALVSNAPVCSGTTSTVLASTPIANLKTSVAPAGVAITLPSNLAGTVSHLQVAISLPGGNENVLNGTLPTGTIQGLNSTLTWSFTESLRPGTASNS